MTMSMNMNVFWDMAPYSLLEFDRRFRRADVIDDERSKHL
jgi:hypothetical protein